MLIFAMFADCLQIPVRLEQRIACSLVGNLHGSAPPPSQWNTTHATMQTRSHFHRPVNARMAASTGWFSCLAARCLGDLTVFLLTLRRRQVLPCILCSCCLMYATSQRVADAPFANPTHHTTMLLTSCNTIMYCFSSRYCRNATRSGRAARA